MKIWNCGNSPPSGSRNAWTRIKKRQRCQSSEQFSNFFGAIQMISCHDWWPWRKPGYITMTRRQSNNPWSGGVTAHPAPKIPSAKIRWKSSSLDFLGSRSILLIDYLPKGQTTDAEYYSLCWCNWRTFWRKNAAGRSPRGSCSCTTMPGSPGTYNPQETGLPGLPVSWSPPYSLDLAPSDYHLFPGLKKKTIERSPFFVRRGGHCCLGNLVGRTTFWMFFFFEWLAKVRATG